MFRQMLQNLRDFRLILDNGDHPHVGATFLADEGVYFSIVKTDGWSGYNGLGALGYEHRVIRKTADVGVNLLPLCHREASLIKRWLDGTHQGAVSHEHLGYYLDEYTFRFNRRPSSYRGKLFYRLLQNAVVMAPTRYHEMVKGVRGRTP